MRCPRCDIEYASDAAFCGQCGATLVTATAPAPPQEQGPPSATAPTLPAAAQAEAPVRISIFSAAVALFILGAIMSELLIQLRFGFVYEERYYEPRDFIYRWAPIGLGVAATLWLTVRRRWTGRLPSALGLVLIIMGLIFVEAIAFLHDSSSLPIVIAPGLLIGLGIGLLVPLAFWRHLNYISPTGKVALVFGAVAGLGAGLGLGSYLAYNVGYAISSGLPILIALFIGLPSVLISPIVRDPK